MLTDSATQQNSVNMEKRPCASNSCQTVHCGMLLNKRRFEAPSAVTAQEFLAGSCVSKWRVCGAIEATPCVSFG